MVMHRKGGGDREGGTQFNSVQIGFIAMTISTVKHQNVSK